MSEFDEELQRRLLDFQQQHGIACTGVACTTTWRKLVEGAGGTVTSGSPAGHSEHLVGAVGLGEHGSAKAKTPPANNGKSSEQEEHDREAAKHWQADNQRIAALGTTREKIVDFQTMTRGDFAEKYGYKALWDYPKDAVRQLPHDLLWRILPLDDATRYQQNSGRVATNADESGNLAREYTPPDTAAGGAVRGGALLGGASRETAENAGKLADGVSVLGGAGLARWARMAQRGGSGTSTPERVTTTTTAGPPKNASTAVAPARAIPPGMSLNEMREENTRARYYPKALEPVAKQPGVDWVDGNVKQTISQVGSNVTQTMSGGTWIQGKRLKEAAEVKTPLDQRVRGAVDEACEKFEKPVKKGVSSRSATMKDGDGKETKLTTRMTNPQDLRVHIEVPDFSKLSKAEQQRLQSLAEAELSLWLDPGGKTYEGLPIEVIVVEAPPDSPHRPE